MNISNTNTSLIDDLYLYSTPSTSYENVDTNQTITNGTEMTVFQRTLHDVYQYFDYHGFILYVILVAGLIIACTIIVMLAVWMCKHKKRVIRQQDDPILANNYDPGFGCRRLFCCCCNHRNRHEEHQTNLEHRQNSASNLEAYGRRAPLPPSAYHPQMIESKPKPPEPNHLGMNIDGIVGVPSVAVPKNRELPPLRLPRTHVHPENETRKF